MKTENGHDSSSDIGYHFMNTYQSCGRKFFLKYILGIEPVLIPRPLAYGHAWHRAIEVFYQSGGDRAKALDAGCVDLNGFAARYKNSSDLLDDLTRLTMMLPIWIDRVGGQILENYNVLSTEESLELTLPNGLRFTGRLDELMERKEDKLIFVGEHKSTTYSLTVMEESVDCQDQVTGYELLVRANKPDLSPRFGGTLLDVTYNKGSVKECRVVEIRRTEFELNRFILELTGITSEIAQKARAYEDKTAADPLLFPRNGSECAKYECPYSAICRSRCSSRMALPDGLEWVDREDMPVKKVLG